MDILNTIKSALGGTSGNKQPDILAAIMDLVGGKGIGLNGLVNQFTANGLEDVISSWIGTGKNVSISPDQIHNALGDDTIKSLSSKLGIDTNSVTSQLSNLLPDVVDKLTPDGKIPDNDLLSKGMDLLGGLLKK